MFLIIDVYFFQNGLNAFVLACESKRWDIADMLYNNVETLIIPDNTVCINM